MYFFFFFRCLLLWYFFSLPLADITADQERGNVHFFFVTVAALLCKFNEWSARWSLSTTTSGLVTLSKKWAYRRRLRICLHFFVSFILIDSFFVGAGWGGLWPHPVDHRDVTNASTCFFWLSDSMKRDQHSNFDRDESAAASAKTKRSVGCGGSLMQVRCVCR